MANQIYPNWPPATAEPVAVNGVSVPPPANLNATDPAAPPLAVNVVWATDASNVSGSVTPGNVSVACAGIPVSDDYSFSIKSVDQDILINSTIPQNAHPAYVNGSPAV